MKAIILAAGKGTRMGDLSVLTPKPMLKVLGKTLLEHKLDSLPSSIDEVILVVGHLKNKITDTIGEFYKGRRIIYVVQDELLGTAHSLFLCKEILKDEKKFLVMMGDDIYSKEDMEECLKYEWSILMREVDSLKGKAKVIFDEEGHIKNILEKYTVDEKGFVCAGMYTMTPKIFDYEMVKITDKEYGLPQTILSAKNDFNIKAIQARFWLQITAPEDLKIAETFLSIK
ncbi:MAG: nucleotidyltransferase family protein [Candidatus Paceibacterota bacterium]